MACKDLLRRKTADRTSLGRRSFSFRINSVADSLDPRTSHHSAWSRNLPKKTMCRQQLTSEARASASSLYLAVLIGCATGTLFTIVVPPLFYSKTLCGFPQHAFPRSDRDPVRRAVLRTRRRRFRAACWQRFCRRGASFHRIHGASSQAVQRGPAVFRSARPQAR